MNTENHWKKIGFRPHHGIVVPLFSIHTKNSHGIGEFLDLIPLIDFCNKIGFDTIQLLPINDSGDDPSPYSILSSISLNPVYISLTPLGINEPELKKLNLTRRVDYAKVKEKKIALLYDFYKSQKRDVDFNTFLQDLAFNQMKQVRDYASLKGCFLKGDLPILVSPYSVDVQANPQLFNHDLVAGAPPDMYNQLGQNWGFPTINWDKMRAENFAWWKHRLNTASNLYHIYRIDHVVGLFRIWAIPKGKKATEGHFIPMDRHLWEAQGKEILSMMLNASSMLPIAEDLGTIPEEVPRTLREFGICGTKVIRWERRWHQDKEYIPLNEYEPFSLTTVSTHDSETLQQWWKNQPEEARLFAKMMHWQYEPTLSEEQRFNLLYQAHHSPSFFHINLLQEYLAVFPHLVSQNPDDERINIPGEILQSNWSYRFKPSLEEINECEPLISMMKQLR